LCKTLHGLNFYSAAPFAAPAGGAIPSTHCKSAINIARGLYSAKMLREESTW
jgi:hypothetical protein